MIFAALAGTTQADVATGPASGLPLPRFVSLKADKVNMHIGPAKTYEVRWLYQRAGLPVEVTAEFENWRRIRDADGAEGWVYHSLLSGRRTVVLKPKNEKDLVPLYDKGDGAGDMLARVQSGVLASVKRCNGSWCRISGPHFDGWVMQEQLWGVYPNEKVE